MNKIDRMIERKEKLKEEIEKELQSEREKFGRWFFNKFDINSSAEAKKIINNFVDDETNNSKDLNENDTNIKSNQF